jgi:hypothetical protein
VTHKAQNSRMSSSGVSAHPQSPDIIHVHHSSDCETRGQSSGIDARFCLQPSIRHALPSDAQEDQSRASRRRSSEGPHSSKGGREGPCFGHAHDSSDESTDAVSSKRSRSGSVSPSGSLTCSCASASHTATALSCQDGLSPPTSARMQIFIEASGRECTLSGNSQSLTEQIEGQQEELACSLPDLASCPSSLPPVMLTQDIKETYTLVVSLFAVDSTRTAMRSRCRRFHITHISKWFRAAWMGSERSSTDRSAGGMDACLHGGGGAGY